jgi:hypothetical protein
MCNAMWSDTALFEHSCKGANFDVVRGDHNQVTWFELKVSSVLVSVVLLTLLSGFHAGLGSLRVHVPILEIGVDSEGGVIVMNSNKFVGEREGRVWTVSTVNHVERRVPCCRRTMAVEGELCASQVCVPISLVGCNVVAEVCTDKSFGMHSLSVCL